LKLGDDIAKAAAFTSALRRQPTRRHNGIGADKSSWNSDQPPSSGPDGMLV
jgi:hypothetical protein